MTVQLNISDEVQDAINEQKPVMALESTILTHGLNRPQNHEAALKFEKTAGDNGAVPATIGIINGQIHIGMTENEIEQICSAENAVKASSHDLAAVITKKLTASTTVATTTMFAQMAGISILATGGLGGVHRNADKTFDISNDITQIGSNQICVVSSGVKSILDISKSLECFETNSIPIYGWKTDDFPAFYSTTSGYHCPYRFDDMTRLMDSVDMHWNFFPSGVIIANPPPAKIALDYDYMESMIQSALVCAQKDKIVGKAITPYLLTKLHELSNGKTEELNVELVESNIRVGAQAAKTLCQQSV